MSHVRTKYIVYSHSGSGVRHHHFSSANNIVDETDDNYPTSSGTHTAYGWPVLPFEGNNLPFAFMSVHGASDGNHLYTSSGNQTVPVGSSNIDIVIVYAPLGGIGEGGGPGIWVDAFNVDAGNFSDDLDFINILTPPTPPDNVDTSKTSFANSDGEVSSLTAEHIRAMPAIDSGVPFLEWKKIIPVESIVSTSDFEMSQDETGEIWFAFYQTVPPSVAIPHVRDELMQALGTWVDDDYCGTPYPHHVGPGPLPFGISIDKKIIKKLNPAQQKKLERYQNEYNEIANAGYSAMRKVTSVLAAVSKIISQIKGR